MTLISQTLTPSVDAPPFLHSPHAPFFRRRKKQPRKDFAPGSTAFFPGHFYPADLGELLLSSLMLQDGMTLISQTRTPLIECRRVPFSPFSSRTLSRSPAAPGTAHAVHGVSAQGVDCGFGKSLGRSFRRSAVGVFVRSGSRVGLEVHAALAMAQRDASERRWQALSEAEVPFGTTPDKKTPAPFAACAEGIRPPTPLFQTFHRAHQGTSQSCSSSRSCLAG